MTIFILMALLAGTPEGGEDGVHLKVNSVKPDTVVLDSLKAEKPDASAPVKPLEEALKEDSTRVLPQPLPGKRKIKGIRKKAVVLKRFTGNEKKVKEEGEKESQLKSVPLSPEKAEEKGKPKE